MKTSAARSPRDRVLDIAWSLGAIEDPDDLIAAAMQSSLGLLGGDQAGFNDIELAAPRLVAQIYPTSSEGDEARTALRDVIADHPVVRHLAATTSTAPVRMSDLVPMEKFRGTPTYQTIFRPRGLRFQLALPLRVDPVTRSGTVYVVNRCRTDFGEPELTMAHALAPVLAALHAAAAARRPTPEQVETARARAGLTERELEMLGLLASGMTAGAIARARRISDRTVRKHLENAYAKLGVHDRLQAVEYCRRHRLLAGPVRTSTVAGSTVQNGA